MSADSVKQWELPSSTGKHFDVLDGIRGIAILMVVAFHVFYVNPESTGVLQLLGKINRVGWIGVPIFFVLSGFLISYPFFRGRAADDNFWYQPGYARRRLGKILPPYYLCIAILVLFELLRPSNPQYLTAAWQSALGLTNFIPCDVVPFNSYWSLIIEAHFYLVLPFLFLLTRGLKPGSTALVLFVVLWLGATLVRHFTWPGPETPKFMLSLLMNRFPTALDFFGWGILFAGVFVSLPGNREGLRPLSLFGRVGVLVLVVTLAFYAFWNHIFDIHNSPTWWAVEIFHFLPSIATFLMLFLIFDPSDPVNRMLSHPALRFIGLVSYEWFLFHTPIFYFFHALVGPANGNLFLYLLKTAVPILLSFGLSALVYRYFSLPLLNRIRGRAPNRAKQ